MQRLFAQLATDPVTVGRYDEARGEDGLRPHFRGFVSHLEGVSPQALRERERLVRETIVAEGVTYNVHASDGGQTRPWGLDVLPHLLPAAEWRTIARGIAQRARLLDAVVADLLGPQELLRQGCLPPAIVFGQRSFPWPVVGIRPPEDVFIHLISVDIARAPDGSFRVVGDRTGAPLGAAYALQNRTALSRAFPDAFRELGVLPLGGYLTALQSSLTALAKSGGEPPLIALLTPGPRDQSYFEHAFLAQKLGFPLVEGQDLLVRNDKVFLKTLRGLRRVHAILRHMADEHTDPVELRADSVLGVSGLIAAARRGNVFIANAIGSSVVEHAAFHAFLPSICERLLGERLLMPALTSHWCGEPDELEYVCAHLSDLVIKPTYPSMRMQPVLGSTLDEAGRALLIDRIRSQPHAYIAQERLRLSRAPARLSPGDASFVSCPMSMRFFAVRTSNGYEVMPGALTRVASDEGEVVSMHWGGCSKDTWVLSDGPVHRAAPLMKSQRARDLRRSHVRIPSRVGENLFWMGRYSERCEASARLLRAALVRVGDSEPGARRELDALTLACASIGLFRRSSLSGAPPRGGAAVDLPDFLAAVADPEIQGSLAGNILRLCASGEHVRERMSADNWHALRRLRSALPTKHLEVDAALSAIDDIMLLCVSLAGFAMDDMSRDESLRFLLAGRRLERLSILSSLLETVLRSSKQTRDDSMEWLLEATNSIVTYRARYRRAPELLPVLHLIVTDPENPHSVMFQALDLRVTLKAAEEELGAKIPSDELARLADGLSALDLETFESESASVEPACAELAAMHGAMRAAVLRLSEALVRGFFSHAGTPAPMTA